MKRYIITWRQCAERISGHADKWQTFEDTFHAVTLPMAVGAWCGKCYANAEIVAVQLVESKGVRQ